MHELEDGMDTWTGWNRMMNEEVDDGWKIHADGLQTVFEITRLHGVIVFLDIPEVRTLAYRRIVGPSTLHNVATVRNVMQRDQPIAQSCYIALYNVEGPTNDVAAFVTLSRRL